MASQSSDDPSAWTEVITQSIRASVESADAKGVVVGLSGGLDSSVVAILAARALGREKVVGVVMPALDSDPNDRRHGIQAARVAGIQVLERSIEHLMRSFDFIVDNAPANVRANAKSRCRMLILYGEAQSRGFLVCGTGNKSELLAGYFTKFGDGGVDLQPIGDLYKTQVRELARHLGVPDGILAKPPSAGLFPGQTDEGEMGLTYEQLDTILRGFEMNQDPAAVAKKSGLPRELVDKVDAMVRRSEHKRNLPTIPKLGARTVGIDWRRAVQWSGEKAPPMEAAPGKAEPKKAETKPAAPAKPAKKPTS